MNNINEINNIKELEEMDVCEYAPEFAEHARFESQNEPCDD
jgi:hypothetical protein